MHEPSKGYKNSRIVNTIVIIIAITIVIFVLWWLWRNILTTTSNSINNTSYQPVGGAISDSDFNKCLEEAFKSLDDANSYVKLMANNWSTTPQQGNILISGSITATNFNGISFKGDGLGLTNLSANNLKSGTISANLLPDLGAITCPSGVGNLTGGGNQAALGGAVCGAISTITNPTFSQITSNTVDSNTITAISLITNNLSAAGNILASSFTGNGSSLTYLNSSNITSGTLAVSQGGTGSNSLT